LTVDSSGTTPGHDWTVIAAHPLLLIKLLSIHKSLEQSERRFPLGREIQILFCSNYEAIPLYKFDVPDGLRWKERTLPARKQQGDGVAGREKKLTLKQTLIKAMAHPLRVRILAYMNDRPWSPNELSNELAEGLSQVSYHVKVLKDFELIEMTKTEPRRGAVEHYYKAIERVFMPSSITKQFPKSAQRGMFVDTMEDTNKDVVASLKSGRFDARDDYHVSYTPADLDNQACEEAEKLADKFVEDFIQLGADSAERRANGEGGGEHIPTSAAVLVFGSEQAEKEKSPSRKPRKTKRQARKKRD
jgi:DNA-binding transcriptional regulator GbsR (MarR family)